MQQLRGRWILQCVALVLSVATAARGQVTGAASPPAKAAVDQLAWVAGAWTGMLGDRIIEQHWMAPLAGTMVGMYRSLQKDKPQLYELLAIEPEGEGLVLRVKHFAPGAGLVSREAKDESVNSPLIRLDGRTAVFEGGTGASAVRVTFSSPDAHTLNITVDRQRDGKPVATEFKYRRIER